MGCQIFHQALAANNSEGAMAIFNELLPYIAGLLMDPFRNYLFQKKEISHQNCFGMACPIISEPLWGVQCTKHIYMVFIYTFLLQHQENIEE